MTKITREDAKKHLNHLDEMEDFLNNWNEIEEEIERDSEEIDLEGNEKEDISENINYIREALRKLL